MASRKAAKHGRYRWDVVPPAGGVAELARRLKTTPLLAAVLANRGLTEPDAVQRFLFPKLTDLHPPELLPDIDTAAERLVVAARSGERICIYGDYDVDGMTAVAILYRLLAMAGANVDYYVPHRLEEGYGVNVEAVEKIAAEGTRLLVTVDCGISAVGPLARAAELGMDVIVTDHHAPGEALPDALAIVHPNLPGREYLNPDLSGAGVAFKLAWQLARKLCGSDRVDEPTREYLLEATSLAALGTVADVVPLTGENRVLAVYGLRGLPACRHAGIRALIESAGLTGEKLDAYHIGFVLAPRLNACGRMGHARAAVELLAKAPPERCRQIAEHLAAANAERQSVERAIAAEAAEMVEAGRAAAPSDHAVVIASPNWHAGVVGIVAARMVERFGRPAMVIAVEGDTAAGSARSIEGFHMRDALAACADRLTGFGGHAMAGGCRLPTERIADFAAAFAAYAAGRVTEEMLTPSLRIDAEAAPAELDCRVVEQLEKLAPFGPGNPRPVVALAGVRVIRPPQRMGRTGSTVSFVVGPDGPPGGRTAGAPLRCVGFGMGDLVEAMAGVRVADVAGRPVLNRFNGRVSVELHLSDVRWG